MLRLCSWILFLNAKMHLCKQTLKVLQKWSKWLMHYILNLSKQTEILLLTLINGLLIVSTRLRQWDELENTRIWFVTNHSNDLLKRSDSKEWFVCKPDMAASLMNVWRRARDVTFEMVMCSMNKILISNLLSELVLKTSLNDLFTQTHRTSDPVTARWLSVCSSQKRWHTYGPCLCSFYGGFWSYLFAIIPISTSAFVKIKKNVNLKLHKGE